MIHLAPIGDLFEGPGLTGRSLATLSAPVSTLCGARPIPRRLDGVLDGVQVMMPHDHPHSCRECLRLLPSRRSRVIPLLLPDEG